MIAPFGSMMFLLQRFSSTQNLVVWIPFMDRVRISHNIPMVYQPPLKTSFAMDEVQRLPVQRFFLVLGESFYRNFETLEPPRWYEDHLISWPPIVPHLERKNAPIMLDATVDPIFKRDHTF